MSISTDNELDRLFSLIGGGEQWIRTSLAKLSPDELHSVISLSESSAETAAGNLMQLGRVLGHGDLDSNEVSALDWITMEIAEKTEVCNTLAAFAREFADPELRDMHMQMLAAHAVA